MGVLLLMIMVCALLPPAVIAALFLLFLLVASILAGFCALLGGIATAVVPVFAANALRRLHARP